MIVGITCFLTVAPKQFLKYIERLVRYVSCLPWLWFEGTLYIDNKALHRVDYFVAMCVLIRIATKTEKAGHIFAIFMRTFSFIKNFASHVLHVLNTKLDELEGEPM